MAFQYQLGYQAFTQILLDLPVKVILLSLAVAVVPFLLYYLFLYGCKRNPRLVHSCLSLPSWILQYREERVVDYRVKEDLREMGGKRELKVGAYLLSFGMALLTVMVFTKMLFFGVVISDSMLPVLEPSHLVLFQAVETRQISEGDVVLFTPPGAYYYVVHRVIRVSEGKIWTKGDNSAYPDDWILGPEHIKGKAVMVFGKPVVVKNFGVYFMPVRTAGLEMDPTFRTTRELLTTMKAYGPAIVLGILILIIMSSFEGEKKRSYA
jgi:signal peptidase I